jgi:hypothetical protein
MDALRLERLVWAALFGLVVAAPLGFFLAPDPTGLVPFAVAALAFAVAVPAVFRAFAFAASPTAEAGDVTARFASFFAVSLALRLSLDAVGFGGLAGDAASLAAGWLAAAYAATRLNPRRWGRGGVSA